jgi:hypothetical protein
VDVFYLWRSRRDTFLTLRRFIWGAISNQALAAQPVFGPYFPGMCQWGLAHGALRRR